VTGPSEDGRPRSGWLVDGLLGPGAPELGCDACFAELDRYVELELAGADPDAQLPGFRAHLAGCLACREEHASLRDLLAGESG
jgi:hypothetical protein